MKYELLLIIVLFLNTMPNKDMDIMGKENIQQWIKEVLLLGKRHKTILGRGKVHTKYHNK